MGAIAVEFKANLACVMTFPEMDQNGDCPGGVVWYQRWKFKRDGDNRPATIRQNGNCSNKRHPWATYVAFIKYSTAEEVSVAEDIHMIEDADMAEGVDMTKEVDVDAEVSIAAESFIPEDQTSNNTKLLYVGAAIVACIGVVYALNRREKHAETYALLDEEL